MINMKGTYLSGVQLML